MSDIAVAFCAVGGVLVVAIVIWIFKQEPVGVAENQRDAKIKSRKVGSPASQLVLRMQPLRAYYYKYMERLERIS
jgi:hypothetical protein